ncbi:unnamed protein product [Didymodactylos carnosus]|nr:unnamed protein product [Didymodactylos carnosus]CAF4433652.1 unnamed protein product [Didymodactylos carnosus]
MQIQIILVVLFLSATAILSKKVDEQHCEVCVKAITAFADTLSDDVKSKPEKIEKAFKTYCSKVKVDSKEHRLCYYIGGLETSATYAIPDVSKPLSWGIPIEKICRERLFKSNPQICDLRYGEDQREIDWNAVDLNKLKVKDLKKILSDWGETADFIEKSEFIKRINEVKSKYVTKQADKKDL